MSAAPLHSVSFGSCQERKLFPQHFAPNRLGNQMSREEAPHLGPGRYEQQFGTIVYELQQRPVSKRGYVVSARTAARFLPHNKTATPSPQKYQQDQSQSKVPPPGRTPFSSTTQRFQSRSSTAEQSPGPGRFSLDVETNRKVSWPMRFGRPDWSKLPQLEKKSLRVKLNSEKELLKQRSRVAYLSLYF
ncbi:ciliary microtubule-associated protein 3 [Genypterus blacodes]|uniref:ciliary microtubule-associated protein 3 n=1 Tax=Genypterus blacodes TaxID=154954 RepID=UPI003F770DF9